MRFFHLADVHLGACPDASFAGAQERRESRWKTFREVVERAEREQADYLLIAGDLFHSTPLLQELREADSILRKLTRTVVVLIAGNHDPVTPGSAYDSYHWQSRVIFFKQAEFSYARLPGTGVYLYGMSYHAREIAEPIYDSCRPVREPGTHILLAHGGDASHAPIDEKKLAAAGFDYVALGHIHKHGRGPGQLFMAGSLEPLDRTETGLHGYYDVRLSDGQAKASFVPVSSFEYRDVTVSVTPEDTAFTVQEKVREALREEEEIAAREVPGYTRRFLFSVVLDGKRDPQTALPEEGFYSLGPIVSVTDATSPELELERLSEEHTQDMLGLYIAALEGRTDPAAKRALEIGVQALLETQKK